MNDVRVVTNENNVSIEVNLSVPIQPTVSFARNPDRLIADFPNVTPQQRLQHIPVGQNGIARVRIGLNRANPPITRVVVDLDALRAYGVEISGNKVLLTILPMSDNAALQGQERT